MKGSIKKNGLAILRIQKWVEAILWRKFINEGDVGAKQALFSIYQSLARKIAKEQYFKRLRQNVERIEIEQLAYEGLLEAIGKFDPRRSGHFKGYARRRIAGNIADGIAAISEVNRQIRTRHKIEQERLRSISLAQKGQDETALEQLAKLATGLAFGLMLEGTCFYGDDTEDERQPNAYDSLVWKEAIQRLETEVEKLPEKQAVILKQYYGHGVKFSQIAELMGLSKGRISQLHGEALQSLRKRLGRF
ncbi:sigma-70 family RNA polymerase sigma factor [Sphingorhabdus sp. Alg239-R122]|uniref:sigma-70 family RNA polymerase sigma factor n=2 Tax=Sphingorhabdus sp. Alg239-R122 TaxID=2305989 RepID=UPI0013DC5A65|nr:sigma-70 family RNA polymerase sigma factor [Sphingorhabdus sp. Alg239-R122]